MDLASVIGIILGFAAVLGGQVLEGGHISSITQPTAAIIVFGGTIGATMLQFPMHVCVHAVKSVKEVFAPHLHELDGIVKTIVQLATKARREGLVAIERDVSVLTNDFLRRAIEMAMDGTEADALRTALELEISRVEEENEHVGKVFEAAGGYAPTVGILGAVLGLIHVMENLSDPSKLGSGIAVAFVATVYGVGSANLIFLPLAGKMKLRHHEEIVMMELVIEGACAITNGENPRLIERKLGVYVRARESGKSAEDAGKAAAKQAAAA